MLLCRHARGFVMASAAMASMYQYRVTRIWNELQAQGKNCQQLLVPDLLELDQYHYGSTQTVDRAAEWLQLTATSHVLDIGAGVGGTARYLAWKYGCQVTGVELQPHLYEAAVQLTRATGLTEQVHLLLGDFLHLEQLAIAGQQFQAWVSLLVFLHIGDRSTLFQNCARVLKPGGHFYIEDYYQRQPLTQADTAILENTLSCPYLPTLEQYRQDLGAAGFTDIVIEDVTQEWQPWVSDRTARFLDQADYYTQIHGAEIFQSFARFYQAVEDLFQRGNVGGVRITGQRPDSPL